jgi:hypothetical protein
LNGDNDTWGALNMMNKGRIVDIRAIQKLNEGVEALAMTFENQISDVI